MSMFISLGLNIVCRFGSCVYVNTDVSIRCAITLFVSSSLGIAHLFQCWWRYREIVSRLRWVLVLWWLSADAPNQLHRRQRKNPTPKKLISFCRSCDRIGRWCFLCYLRSLWSPFVDHFFYSDVLCSDNKRHMPSAPQPSFVSTYLKLLNLFFWSLVTTTTLYWPQQPQWTGDLQLTAEWWWPASINIYWYSGDCHPKGLVRRGILFSFRLNRPSVLSGGDDIPINQSPTRLTILLFYDSLFLLLPSARTSKAKRVHTLKRVATMIRLFSYSFACVTHKFNK